jgi:hypothetical protein
MSTRTRFSLNSIRKTLLAVSFVLICPPTMALIVGETPPLIEQDIRLNPLFQKCQNLSAPPAESEAACREMLRLTEHLPQSDIRYRAAIEGLSIRTANIEEQYRLSLQTLELLEKYDSDNHREIMATKAGLARIRASMEYWDDAAARYEAAIAYGKKHLDPNNLELAANRLIAGAYYLRRGQLQDAEIHLDAAYRAALKAETPYELMRLNIASQSARLIAQIYRKKKLDAEADRYQKSSDEFRAKIFEPK